MNSLRKLCKHLIARYSHLGGLEQAIRTRFFGDSDSREWICLLVENTSQYVGGLDYPMVRETLRDTGAREVQPRGG